MKNPVVIIIAGIILVCSFFVFTHTGVFMKGYSTAKNALGEITGPVLRVIGKPFELVGYVFSSYFNLIRTKKENEALRSRVDVLQLQNQKIPELEQENRRLKTLLSLMEQRPKTMIAARVVGEDVKNWFKCIIIDKGLNHGIREKMPVITSRGLVGQVVDPNRLITKVMVINDTSSSVDVYVDGKNTRGILEGTGQTLLKLKYIRKNDEIEIGDRLITSGKDSIYPKGLATGIVTTVNLNKPGIFADVDVMPFNNFKRLEEVLIVKR